MSTSITSLRELYAQKRELRTQLYEHEMVLKEKFETPGSAITNTLSILKEGSERFGESEREVERNILLKLSVFVLPLAVKPLVVKKKTGLLVNSLMVLLSAKAASKTDTDILSTITAKVKGFFAKKPSSTRFKAYRKPGREGMIY